MRGLLVAFVAALAFTGCGPSTGGDHGDDANATLTIDPPTSELLIDNGILPTEDFTATLTYPDGFTRDVTNEVHFNVDSGYAMFTANTLTAQAAGKTQVFASWTDKLAVAQLIIKLRNVRVDPGLPVGAADWFTNNPEDPTRAPTIVYPPADVVIPRNLGDFEVHWTDATNNVFELSLKTEFTDVRVIVPGGNGSIANSSWQAFLAVEWMAAVSNETTVTYQVRGVDQNNPTVIGSGAPQIVKLSNEQMLGGLYYWAATAQNGPYGIFRHDMAKPGQPAEQFYTTAQTGGRCVACHVLSRDGTKMAVTYDGGDGMATLVDVATKTPQTTQRGWNFGAFTPDGTKFLANRQGTLTVIDYTTQATLATMTASGYVTHPDLSADGTRLVYVQGPGGTSDWSFGGGKIFTRTFDPATNSFGPEQLLVADTNNNYYPSISPDGQWVLFNRAAGGSSYNNGNATLFVTKADGTGIPIELAKSNQGLGLTNSWGRWAPFQQTIGAANEPMYWVTVSSTRNFGVRLVGVNRPQIWMTPFFPTKAAGATDPSNAAFRLPFQNIDSNNHIAQWTEQVVEVQ
ncbi:MAG TPA: hypothetical protein VFV99_23495 [Kofleriaceae bacterium]|nr:hypothetical protein [Kofleriaceae bacterium]